MVNIMRLHESKSANSVSYYIIEGFRNEKGHCTSRVVERLGSAKKIREKYGEDIDPREWCLKRLAELEALKKANKPYFVNVRLKANQPYKKNTDRSIHVGYLWLQKILYNLGFSTMIKDIKSRHNFKFDLEKILSDLIYNRIIEPCSKKSAYDFCSKTLIEKPNYELHDVYRALDVIENESDFIQSFVYNHNDNVDVKNSNIMFYDCTNFYFEIKQEDDFRRNGYSKEGRFSPLVQMGMFIDGNGIPLAFSIFNGNSSEQQSLVPLQKKILSDFNLPNRKLYVCTDAGLCSFHNKFFNSNIHPGKLNNVDIDYVIIHPIRKMSQEEQNWVLDKARSLNKNPLSPEENPQQVRNELERNGWHEEGSDNVFSLDDIDEDDPKNFEKVFYKERYVKRIDAATNLEIDDRIIVTYSIKYKKFMQRKREKNIKKAEKIIKAKDQKQAEIKSNDKVRKIIKIENLTEDGKKAKISKYSVDEEAISLDERYDGFYAVSTSISEDLTVSDIIKINKGRWQIEESFMLMKAEFKSRPVFVKKAPHIKAHFATCFLGLLVFRLLEKEVNDRSETLITAPELLKAIRSLKINALSSTKSGYTGSVLRTEITDVLHSMSPVRFDCEYISASDIKRAIKISKK